MNEKAYKTMSLAGAAGITVGIIVMVTGCLLYTSLGFFDIKRAELFSF